MGQVLYHRREEGEPGSAEQEGTSNPKNEAPLEAAADPVLEVRFSLKGDLRFANGHQISASETCYTVNIRVICSN